MQFAGIPLDDLRSLALFIACLATALGLVYLFCRNKFGERSSSGSGSDDLVDQMLPRYLATREEYSKGFLTYFATMAGTVLLLSLIGPKDLAALGVPLPKEISSVVVPLAAALLLTGVMPNVPVLLEIEKWVRKYAHERAYIPAAARATAQRMAAAEFDFTAYADALREPEMRGVEAADFTKSRRSLEHDWARLSCLVYEQRSRRTAGMLSRSMQTCCVLMRRIWRTSRTSGRPWWPTSRRTAPRRRLIRPIPTKRCAGPSATTSTSCMSCSVARCA